MYIYIVMIALLFIFSFGRLGRISNIAIFRFFIVAMWFLASFRAITVGADTESYFRLFNDLAINHSVARWTWRYEEGYLIFNNIISYITDNFTVFLMIINTLFYAVYYKFITKYSRDYVFSALLFFVFGVWANTANVLRLEIAVVINLIAYMMIDSGKKILGRILPILGVFFQRISIVYILALFIPQKINKKFFKFSFLASLAVLVGLKVVLPYVGSFIPYFSEYYLSGTSSYVIGEIKQASIINTIVFLAIFLFCYRVYINNHYLVDENEKKVIEGELVYVYVSFLFMMVSLGFNLLDRCTYFFFTFAIVLIPNILSMISDRNNRVMLKFLIALFGILYFFIINVLRPEWNGIVPYLFIWSA